MDHETPDYEALQELRADAEAFETYLRTAVEEKWSGTKPVPGHRPIERWSQSAWNVETFNKAYVQNAIWPLSRLPRLQACVKDIRIEFYYLTEVDLGLYNKLYHDPINSDPTLAGSNRLVLLRQSLDQALIGKIRILWERIFVMIYWMEFGREIAGKSTKGSFFKAITEDNRRWGWIAAYEPIIKKYDDLYRTPEFHAGSRLRKELQGEPPPDANALLTPVNHAMNAVWHNVLEVAGGGVFFTFDRVHMTGGDAPELDPKWRAWVERVVDEADDDARKERAPQVIRR